jgi:predicted TIM-barrel fold metal-dependent hydrolase
MVVGIILGASIFVQPAEINRHVPTVPGVFLVWTVAGTLTLFGALVSAELASAFPRTGGVYVFLKETLSPVWGFLWGWAMFWSVHSGIIAATSVILARYIAYFLPLDDLGVRVTAICGVLLLSWINYLGVRQGSLLQTVVTAAKVLAILLLLAMVVAFGAPAGPAAAAGAAAPPPFREFVLAVSAALFAFGGWHMVTYAAGETRDPARTIPRALVAGSLTVTACYVALNAAYLYLLPLDRAVSSPRVAAEAVPWSPSCSPRPRWSSPPSPSPPIRFGPPAGWRWSCQAGLFTISARGSVMRIIDFHNHYYPPAYLEALRSGPSAVRVTVDEQGNPCLHYAGDYNIAVPGHRDIGYRARVLAAHGVDMQVLTLTTPGVHVESPATAARLSTLVNDAFAEVSADASGRFTALATLPLNDPAAAVKELRRALRQLGFRGAMLFSNGNGVALSDERYWPLYEAADGAGAVLYIHPTHPPSVEAMADFWLMPLVGFPFDTTLAAASLVFRGVAERFPRIRWVLAHLGGAIPYLAERLDRGFHAFRECRAHIARPPSDYLRRFFYDAVNFDAAAIRLAIAFAGADHILAGSDYPHQIGSLPRMIETIRGLEVSEQDRSAIFGANAARLLELGARP